MVRAALNGALDGVTYRKEDLFGLMIPESCPEVPAGILSPRSTWTDPAAYDEQARRLIGRFEENFEQFRGEVSAEIAAAGPSNR
jgi:phosphoenolpyruvate carboxykinase (ATP)